MRNTNDYITSDAWISPCQKYRYSLSRTWKEGGSSLTVIGLNPSTADGKADDKTIRKCVKFAKKMGHNKLVMVNLFAYRATDPKELLGVKKPVGPLNDKAIHCALMDSLDNRNSRVVAAWGRSIGKLAKARLEELFELQAAKRVDIYCFGQCKDGSPKHPLYLNPSVVDDIQIYSRKTK